MTVAAIYRDRVVLADVLLDVFSSSRVAFICSKYEASRWVPWRTVPSRGASSPSKSRSTVVFPDPLGPITPNLSPRRIVVVKSRMTRIPISEANALSLDDQGACALGLLGLHARGPLPLLPLLMAPAHRLERADASFVAVQRASTPWRIHVSSCASFLSKSSTWRASAASKSSRRLRKVG